MSDLTDLGRTPKLIGTVALSDVLIGIVLSVIGVASDITVMKIAGVVLLLSGGGMLAYVAWTRNRPGSL